MDELKNAQEAANTLTVFNRKFELMTSYSFFRTPKLRFSQHFKVGEPSRTESEGPTDEQIDAVLLNMRFFVVRNEWSSLLNLERVYALLELPNDVHQKFRVAFDRWSAWKFEPSRVDALTKAELFNAVCYGDRIHLNQQKHFEIFSSLQKNELIAKFAEIEFAGIIFELTNILASIYEANVEALKVPQPEPIVTSINKDGHIECPPHFTINPKHHRSQPRSQKKFDLYRLAIANDDVSAAVYIADEFIGLLNRFSGDKTIPHYVVEAFLSAIVVSYARPFMDNDSDIKLPNKWGKFKDPSFREGHLDMLKLRGQLYGHSSAESHVMQIIPAGYFHPKLKRQIPRTSWGFNTTTPPPHAIVGFRRVANDLQQRLEAEVSRLVDDLYGDMELPRVFPS